MILEEAAGKLDKKIKSFFDLYGSFIDMLNIQLVYRGKSITICLLPRIVNYSINKGNKFDYKKGQGPLLLHQS